MFQIVEQTHEEKIAMYMKLTKAQLAEMLVNCNIALAAAYPSPLAGPSLTKTTWSCNRAQ